MREKDFLKRITELGYCYGHEVSESELGIYTVDGGLKVAAISEDYEKTLTVRSDDFMLITLCVDYAGTPLEYRVEQKYTVCIPELSNPNTSTVLAKTDNGTVGVLIIPTDEIQSDERCWLTENEIMDEHAYLWRLAKEVDM